MAGENKKGYNNPDSWDKLENNNKAQKIDVEKNYIDFEEQDSEDDDTDFVEDASIDDSIMNETNETENFDEVLQLTQYNDQSLVPSNYSGTVAEYQDIDIVATRDIHQKTAKAFVSKITKFILDFNDVNLSEAHKNYIKQVGNLQLQHLTDLLYLTDVNKQMLNNIVARVNATMAEDYAIINSYNNLINQHLKLIKELQTTYRAIPTVLKKMKADVLCNQELGEGENGGDEVITENYGETQFTSGKHLLRKLIDDRNNKKLESEATNT